MRSSKKSAYDPSRLPLSALLSQVLVAFTIELDNEFERLMPHRTSEGASASDAKRGVWLTSLVMYANVMQYVGEEGIGSAELYWRAKVAKPGLSSMLKGLRRWGHLTIKPNEDGDGREGNGGTGRWMIRPTELGSQARNIWRELPAAIERRWDERFGKAPIKSLRAALIALVKLLDVPLPEYFPILRYGLRAEVQPRRDVPARPQIRSEVPLRTDGLPLYALLSKALLAFTSEFEERAEVSLGIGSNVLRLLKAKEPVRYRDLPRFSGISKEAISMAVGFLERSGYTNVAPGPAGSRGEKVVRLTVKGQRAARDYFEKLDVVEESWRKRFGDGAIDKLRSSLGKIVGVGLPGCLPLALTIHPQLENWRASRAAPESLPWQIVPLHRGGYPDGS